jgi:hypothetical protein
MIRAPATLCQPPPAGASPRRAAPCPAARNAGEGVSGGWSDPGRLAGSARSPPYPGCRRRRRRRRHPPRRGGAGGWTGTAARQRAPPEAGLPRGAAPSAPPPRPILGEGATRRSNRRRPLAARPRSVTTLQRPPPLRSPRAIGAARVGRPASAAARPVRTPARLTRRHDFYSTLYFALHPAATARPMAALPAFAATTRQFLP